MALMEAESGRAQHENGALDTLLGGGPNGEDVPVEDGLNMPDEKIAEAAEKGELFNAAHAHTGGSYPGSGYTSGAQTPHGTRTPEKRALPPMPGPVPDVGPKQVFLPPPMHPSQSRTPSGSAHPVQAVQAAPAVPAYGSLMPPTMGRPGFSQHSSTSQYSNDEESEAAPPIDDVRRTAQELEKVDINAREGTIKGEDQGVGSPMTIRGDAPLLASTEEGAVKKGGEEVAVHRQEDQYADGPPEYDESLR